MQDADAPKTLAAFSRFLGKQYGDIQSLNRAWATYFTTFEAISNVPPNFRVWSWSSVVAEHDWQRFRSMDFAAQVHRWRAIIREVDPETSLFIDVLGSDMQQNRTGNYYGVSDWDAVEATDVLGLSCYANILGKEWWESCAWQWTQFWRHGLSRYRVYEYAHCLESISIIAGKSQKYACEMPSPAKMPPPDLVR